MEGQDIKQMLTKAEKKHCHGQGYVDEGGAGIKKEDVGACETF
jgi:hypothetical protein